MEPYSRVRLLQTFSHVFQNGFRKDIRARPCNQDVANDVFAVLMKTFALEKDLTQGAPRVNECPPGSPPPGFVQNPTGGLWSRFRTPLIAFRHVKMVTKPN